VHHLAPVCWQYISDEMGGDFANENVDGNNGVQSGKVTNIHVVVEKLMSKCNVGH